MTADIRTAAEREAEKLHKLHPDSGMQDIETAAFAAGAVWGAARVTPTREQIAEACEGYLANRFTDPRHPHLEFVIEDSFGCADATLALLAGLAEGEDNGEHE